MSRWRRRTIPTSSHTATPDSSGFPSYSESLPENDSFATMISMDFCFASPRISKHRILQEVGALTGLVGRATCAVERRRSCCITDKSIASLSMTRPDGSVRELPRAFSLPRGIKRVSDEGAWNAEKRTRLALSWHTLATLSASVGEMTIVTRTHGGDEVDGNVYEIVW